MQRFEPKAKIAFFITPHGFGHAARAAAVIEALHNRIPGADFELFTSIPEWFFKKSLAAPFTYHHEKVDIGLVQTNPLFADYARTIDELDRFIPFDPGLIDTLVGRLIRMNCTMVLCDISPLGIAAARQAGIKSVLIENFTWDWVYSGIAKLGTQIGNIITYLKDVNAQADYRIQTEPQCKKVEADQIVGPVSRLPRRSAEEIRRQLRIAPDAKMILVTMGGVKQDYSFLDVNAVPDNVHLVISGGDHRADSGASVTWLPMDSDFYHPDLMNACDAVVAKVGYSTLAEAYNSGVPFGYIRRPDFQESEILAGFVETNMNGIQITADALNGGKWHHQIQMLAEMPRSSRGHTNGAQQISEFLAVKITEISTA